MADNHDERLGEIIAGFLKAIERGGLPDPEELVTAHPEFADDLRSFFVNHERMQREVGEDPPDEATTPATIGLTLASDTSEQASSRNGAAAVGDHVRYFGDYELLEEIARGGMGVVYKARQVNLNRIVALKMILSGQLASETDVLRFHAEAEAAANLDHPNIVPIFEVGEHNGQHYFSMGFVQGESLADRVAKGPLPPREGAELVKTLAEAIQYAHDRGVIHRDLKPANVLLEVGEASPPRLTDFGLAKRLEDDSGLTHTGQILGTPAYMPPEQASGKVAEVAETADVYSLGAILYCLLVGRPPFQAANVVETVQQVLSDEPAAPRTINPAIPLDLETIAMKCLEKDRKKRYASAQHLAEELGRFVRGEPIHARPISRAEHAWRWCGRNPAVASLLALTAGSLLAGAAVAGYFAVLANDRAAEAESQRQAAMKLATEKVSLAEAAIAAEKETGIALKREQKARQNAEELLYASTLAQAQREWKAARATEAIRILQSTKSDLRGWEYGYLHHLFHHAGRTPVFSDATWIATTVAVSASGMRFAAANHHQRKLVRVWRSDAPDDFLAIEENLKTSPEQIALSPDGSQLAVRGREGVMQVFNAETGEEQYSIPQTPRAYLGDNISFSPDGKWLTAPGLPQKEGLPSVAVQFWEAATGEEAFSLKGFSARCISFSHDGARLAAGGGTIRIWDLKTKELVFARNAGANDVCFHPDGKRLASVFGNEATIWDTDSAQTRRWIADESGILRRVRFSPKGDRLATQGMGGPNSPIVVNIWDVGGGNPLFALQGVADYDFCFLPDGKQVLASGGGASGIALVDAVRGQSPHKIEHGVAISGDANWVATLAPPGTKLQVSDAYTGSERRTLAARDYLSNSFSIHLNGDGDRLAVVTIFRSKVPIFNVPDESVVANLEGHKDFIHDLSFSPHDGRVATASEDRTVKLFETDSGRVLWSTETHQQGVIAVAFDASGTRIVGLVRHGPIKIWDAASGAETAELLFPGAGVWHDVASVCFSPDGTRVACTHGKNVLVWDLATRKHLFTLEGHTGEVRSVCFNKSGTRIATGSADTTVRLWNAITARQVLSLRENASEIQRVQFVGDNTLAAFGKSSGSVFSDGVILYVSNQHPEAAETPTK